MSTEEQSNPAAQRSKPEEIKMNMNTQSNQNMAAPMRFAGAVPTHRKSIDELLSEVRFTHPVWYSNFEDAHLSVAASADIEDVAELIATAPSERLAGLVEGLYINN